MMMKLADQNTGSVLMMTVLTMTILILLCATSLYVASQNGNSTTQATSWQQAMAGAEAAVDQAMKALNKNEWTGWYTVTPTGSPSAGALPSVKPSPAGTPNATAVPGNGQYNYYTTSFTLQGEASNTVSTWVTIDNGSLSPVSSNLNNNGQAYRIRAVGIVGAPGPKRVSNNKLDNDLRKINLVFDRISGTSSNGEAVRRVELVAVPIVTTTSIWGRAIALKSSILMSGSSWIDSFDSSNPFQSTGGLYDLTKRQSHAQVATTDSTGSDLKGMYVYGDLQYSGPAVKNAQNVEGTTSTPYNGDIPAAAAPNWSSGTYTNAGSLNGSGTIAAGTKANPARYKYSSLTVPGGGVLTISGPNSGTDNNYIEIWVTGKFTTSGSGLITQQANVHATIYVGDDITVSGSSYNNQSGLASNVNFVAYGPSGNKLTDSGGGQFIGTVLAPNYDVTISGSGSFSGALIANTLNLSGGGGFHYDESLGTNSSGGSTTPGIANYAYASWFEDNSDPARGITY